MNSLDVIRKLKEAAEAVVDMGYDDKPDTWGLIDNAISEAEAYLKTGGWHKWPEEKPEEGETCFVLCGDELDPDTCIYYSDGWKWDSYDIRYWQSVIRPLPPLPSDKPEEK